MSLGERRSIRGLGLVEALVATTLAAALIAGLLAILGVTSEATARLEQERLALSLAQALLSEPVGDTQSGTTDGLRWERHVTPSPYAADLSTQDGYRLQTVRVTVFATGSERSVSVSSERVMR